MVPQFPYPPILKQVHVFVPSHQFFPPSPAHCGIRPKTLSSRLRVVISAGSRTEHAMSIFRQTKPVILSRTGKRYTKTLSLERRLVGLRLQRLPIKSFASTEKNVIAYLLGTNRSANSGRSFGRLAAVFLEHHVLSSEPSRSTGLES